MPLKVTRYYFIPAGTTSYDFFVSGSANGAVSRDVEISFLLKYTQFDSLQELFDDNSNSVVRYDDGFGYTYWQITSEVTEITTINQGTTPIKRISKGTDLVWARYYTVIWQTLDGLQYRTDYVPYGTYLTPPDELRQWNFTYNWGTTPHLVTDDETIMSDKNTTTWKVIWKAYNGTILKEDTKTYAGTSSAPTGTADDVQYNYYWPQNEVNIQNVTPEVITVNEQRTTQIYDINWRSYAGIMLKYDDIPYGGTSYAPTGTADTAQYDYYWPVSSVTNVSADQTIVETRTTRTYTIVWKNYAGTTIRTDSNQPYGTSLSAPTGTTDTAQWNYFFGTPNITVTGDATITEQRSLRTYEIEWYLFDQDINGDIPIKHEVVSYGSTSTAPTGTADTAQYDYSWPYSSVTVTGALKIQETRVVKNYTVTWKNYAGTILRTDNHPYGASLTPPTGTLDTAQYDYSWPVSSVTVSENRIIQETRVTKTYTVTWKDYAGTTLRTDSNKPYGTSLTAPSGSSDTAQYDYSWPVSSVSVTENRTIQETRVTKTYTVTWKDYAGTTLRTDSNKPYGTSLSAPTGTTDTAQWNYYFATPNVTVTGNATIQETRTIRRYTVTWKNYAGTILRTDSNQPYGTSLSAPTGTADTAQYDYSWPVSSVTVTGNATIQETRTLRTYTVTWKNWDNSTLKTETVAYGGNGTPPADPSRSGYVFTGWSGDYTGITGNVTITAQYNLIGTSYILQPNEDFATKYPNATQAITSDDIDLFRIYIYINNAWKLVFDANNGIVDPLFDANINLGSGMTIVGSVAYYGYWFYDGADWAEIAGSDNFTCLGYAMKIEDTTG